MTNGIDKNIAHASLHLEDGDKRRILRDKNVGERHLLPDEVWTRIMVVTCLTVVMFLMSLLRFWVNLLVLLSQDFSFDFLPESWQPAYRIGTRIGYFGLAVICCQPYAGAAVKAALIFRRSGNIRCHLLHDHNELLVLWRNICKLLPFENMLEVRCIPVLNFFMVAGAAVGSYIGEQMGAPGILLAHRRLFVPTAIMECMNCVLCVYTGLEIRGLENAAVDFLGMVSYPN